MIHLLQGFGGVQLVFDVYVVGQDWILEQKFVVEELYEVRILQFC